MVAKWWFKFMKVVIQNNAKHLQNTPYLHLISLWLPDKGDSHAYILSRNISKTTSVSHSYDVMCVLNIFHFHCNERENKKPWKLARVQNSAISEHDIETGHVPVKDQVRFIDHDFHCHTERVKEACHIRLYPYNEKRNNRIEIPETWMQTI